MCENSIITRKRKSKELKMEKLLKSRLVTYMLILILASAIFVFAGDVVVQEGLMKAEVFKTTGCTATGTKAVALGYETEATGAYSFSMGYQTIASGTGLSTALGCWTEASAPCSTAMGVTTTASGSFSTAIGGYTKATAPYSTAFGMFSENNISNSFTIGYGVPGGNDKVDFRVESGLVTVGDVSTNDTNLYVTGWVSGEDLIDRSSFYDKDTYGRAPDYLVDSSNTIRLNAEGQKEYNNEADPEFVQRWITLKDYDKYTDEEVWIEELNETITRRIYETHQELGSSVTMKLSWLTQCVFELKQENQVLKDEIAKLKTAVGIE
jgi:hypothetical protein